LIFLTRSSVNGGLASWQQQTWQSWQTSKEHVFPEASPDKEAFSPDSSEVGLVILKATNKS